jgi:hypothetical protein
MVSHLSTKKERKVSSPDFTWSQGAEAVAVRPVTHCNFSPNLFYDASGSSGKDMLISM